jgi:hypothetical protein
VRLDFRTPAVDFASLGAEEKVQTVGCVFRGDFKDLAGTAAGISAAG